MKKIPALIPILPFDDSDVSNSDTHDRQAEKTTNIEKKSLSNGISVGRDTTKRRQFPLPYIRLPMGNDDFHLVPPNAGAEARSTNQQKRIYKQTNKTSIMVGRIKLLLSTASACQCLSYIKCKDDHNNDKERLRVTCNACKELEKWVCKYISKEMIRIDLVKSLLDHGEEEKYGEDENGVNNNTDNYINSSNNVMRSAKGENLKWNVHCIGQNSKKVVRIINNDHPQQKVDDDCKESELNTTIRIGSIILFKNANYTKFQKKKERSASTANNNISCCANINMSGGKCDKNDIQQSKKSSLQIQQMKFIVGYINILDDDDESNDVVKSEGSLKTSIPSNSITYHNKFVSGQENVEITKVDKDLNAKQNSVLPPIKTATKKDIHAVEKMVKYREKQNPKKDVTYCATSTNGKHVQNTNTQQKHIQSPCSINLDEFYSRPFENNLVHNDDDDNHDNHFQSKSEQVQKKGEDNRVTISGKKGSNQPRHNYNPDQQGANLLISVQEPGTASARNEGNSVQLDGRSDYCLEQETKDEQMNKSIIDLKSSLGTSLSKMKVPQSVKPDDSGSTIINDSKNGTVEDEHAQDTKKDFTIFFLHRGRSMSKSRIAFLKNALLKKVDCYDQSVIEHKIGLKIFDKFDKDDGTFLNYIVVDGCLTIQHVSVGLGFDDIQTMGKYFEMNDQTQIIKPEWVINATNLLEKPRMDHIWTGTYELKHLAQKQKECQDIGANTVSSTWLKRKRRPDQFPEIETIAASKSNNEMIQRLSKYRKLDQERAYYPRNHELAAIFQKISKLYKEMPLDTFDEWRSYSYNAASVKLKYLDFPVCKNEDSLSKLRSCKGFGQKFMRHVSEFLRTGKCQLITEFEHDPTRLRVRNMIRIWGIGSKKAFELVKLGYTDITSVRMALQRNELDIDKNAKVGVQFYEDFQEKMDRIEVEKIGEIVSKYVKRYFKSAEITIMGSYRRGSELCGDVDILITHPKFFSFVPKGAVADLVERLREDGHISHHLTVVDTTQKEIFYQRRGNFDDILINSSKESESYMGVFVSPIFSNKHRRIDIKFYSYREKPFASLYFTGNGWFNRGMRWYAKSKKKMKLNDKGLYHIESDKRIKAKSEEEIFKLLGLVYKSPRERDSINALIPTHEQNLLKLDIGLDHSDFQAECKHTWVD